MLHKLLFGRLPRYFAFVFLKQLLLLVFTFALLIFLITFVEILRKTSGDDFDLLTKVIMTAKQIPFIIEQILPLVILLSGIWTVITLTRHSELIVAKAAGVSLWRLTVTFSAVSFCVGTLMVLCFNPFSTQWIKEYYTWNATRKVTTINSFSEKIVQNNKDVIFIAQTFNPSTLNFADVTLYFLDDEKILSHGLTAKRAEFLLDRDVMSLDNVTFFDSQKLTQDIKENYLISFPEIRPFLRAQTKVNDMYNFYEYQTVIDRAVKNNTNHHLLRSQYYNLIFYPVLCAVMAVTAVLATPKFMRKGSVFKNIAFGILFGFCIYAFDMILVAFGRSELLPLLVSVSFVKLFSIFALIWFILWHEYGYGR